MPQLAVSHFHWQPAHLRPLDHLPCLADIQTALCLLRPSLAPACCQLLSPYKGEKGEGEPIPLDPDASSYSTLAPSVATLLGTDRDRLCPCPTTVRAQVPRTFLTVQKQPHGGTPALVLSGCSLGGWELVSPSMEHLKPMGPAPFLPVWGLLGTQERPKWPTVGLWDSSTLLWFHAPLPEMQRTCTCAPVTPGALLVVVPTRSRTANRAAFT